MRELIRLNCRQNATNAPGTTISGEAIGRDGGIKGRVCEARPPIRRKHNAAGGLDCVSQRSALDHDFKVWQIVELVVEKFRVFVPIAAPSNFDSLSYCFLPDVSGEINEARTVFPIYGIRNDINCERREGIMFAVRPIHLREALNKLLVLFSLTAVPAENL